MRKFRFTLIFVFSLMAGLCRGQSNEASVNLLETIEKRKALLMQKEEEEIKKASSANHLNQERISIGVGLGISAGNFYGITHPVTKFYIIGVLPAYEFSLSTTFLASHNVQYEIGINYLNFRYYDLNDGHYYSENEDATSVDPLSPPDSEIIHLINYNAGLKSQIINRLYVRSGVLVTVSTAFTEKHSFFSLSQRGIGLYTALGRDFHFNNSNFLNLDLGVKLHSLVDFSTYPNNKIITGGLKLTYFFGVR